MQISDERFYKDVLGITDDAGQVPAGIVEKHDAMRELYRRRGMSGVPVDVMMGFALDYQLSKKWVAESKAEASEVPVVTKKGGK